MPVVTQIITWQWALVPVMPVLLVHMALIKLETVVPVKIERVLRTLVPVRMVTLQREQVVLQFFLLLRNVRRVLEAII